MDTNTITHIISLILAPVVMISSCIVFLNGQFQRYDAISARMRTMIQERFTILSTAGDTISVAMDKLDDFSHLRLSEIEVQLPHLLKRHKMLHDAALILGLAILLFIISMFLLALTSILNAQVAALLALLAFLGGMATALFGGSIVMQELYQSHLSVRYEVMHSLSLGKNAPPLTTSHKRIQLPHLDHLT